MAQQKAQYNRKYYSQRTGKKKPEMDLIALRKMFLSIYSDFSQRAYFDEYLDDYCPDSAGNSGKAGDVSALILRKLRKNYLWPIHTNVESYAEEDIFDIIEFLFDHISAPLESDKYFHQFYSHDHYVHFDQKKGQEEYRNAINEILNDYGPGYELTHNGEVCALLEEEFRLLLGAPVPTDDPENIEAKVTKAINKFRKYGSTLDDRHDAVRALADCLEFIRKNLQTVLTEKDDADLFNIANNFGIRHHNEKQKTGYERTIWLSWMFYFYLATIHAGLRFMQKKQLDTV